MNPFDGDLSFEICVLRSEIENLKFEIRNRRLEIGDLESKSLHLKPGEDDRVARSCAGPVGD